VIRTASVLCHKKFKYQGVTFHTLVVGKNNARAVFVARH